MIEQVKSDPAVRRAIVASDISAHGTVVIWDHGPTEPEVDHETEEHKRYETEATEWHRVNGDGPVPTTMDSQQAAHAMQVEPTRYALDPIDLSDADVDAEIKRMHDEREAVKKASDERAATAQLATDRKAAITIVMARRAREAEVERAANPRARPGENRPHLPENKLDLH